MSDFKLSELPPLVELETKAVLKQAIFAGRALAELKGVSKTIPNQAILINTLPLLEAKDSSEIENIITTHDELYKEDLFGGFIANAAVKEVKNYTNALKTGFEKVMKHDLLTNNLLLEVQACIEKNPAGFRKLPGTELKNAQTGEIVYTPPQKHEDVINLMTNLEKVINDDGFFDIEPLVKMAIIHYQFESIHPFYDGNGRTGRILNILYLAYKGLLDLPVLYLSHYIIKTKGDYYRLLQEVRDKQNWEEWILYLLKGIEITAKNTITLVENIRELMASYKHRIREEYKFYSQDLLNNLFCHPYTKIEFLEHDIGVTRQTASKYLEALTRGGFLEKAKIGNHNFYINRPLFEMFLKS